MRKDLTDKDIELAGEFSMGVLEGKNLTTAQIRFEQDYEFRCEVEEWQQKLAPMLDEIAPVSPDASVWQEIEKTVGTELRDTSQGIWSSLNFWRLLAGFSSASLAALVFWVVAISPSGFLGNKTPEKILVATLSAGESAPSFVARYDQKRGVLLVQGQAPDKPIAKVAELWIIPSDGVPKSLGLLSSSGNNQLIIASKIRSDIISGGTLAVSIEPLGGSPTGAPTGPVVATGKLQLL